MAFRGNIGRLGVAALAVAGLAAGSVFMTAPVHAQSPSSVPAARFYGHATFPSGAASAGSAVTATVAGVACSVSVTATGGVATGSTDNLGNYALDIQSVPGCTTPGGTVTFTASGLRAQQSGTLPQIPGTAVHLDLTFAAAATPTATAAPPPPPPPSTPAATPAATATRAATVAPPPPSTATVRPPVATPRVQAPAAQAPKGPVTAQAPARAAAPVAQAPAAAPRLPSTGTGGLLDQQSSNSLTGWALLSIVLAALGVSASGLVAYRRSL